MSLTKLYSSFKKMPRFVIAFAVDALTRQIQRGDVLEADSEFGTHTWEYTGDSWNPRFQLNPAQVKNIPKGALHNAR